MNPLVVPDPGLYIWTILVFLALLWGASKVFWRPLMAMLREREDTIRKSLDDARKAKQELERLHVESQRILAERPPADPCRGRRDLGGVRRQAAAAERDPRRQRAADRRDVQADRSHTATQLAQTSGHVRRGQVDR